MSQEFLQEHKNTINTAINSKPVIYTTSSGKNNVVHCYYIDANGVCISAYAIKNKKTHVISKYILKINLNGTKSEFTDNTAQKIYNILYAKHDEQIARTQLRKNFHNKAFTRKR